MSLIKHLKECAAEMGIEWPAPVSHERKMAYRDRDIEIWYDESGSIFAWKAFVYGIGTSSGASEEEAVERAMARIDKESGRE